MRAFAIRFCGAESFYVRLNGAAEITATDKRLCPYNLMERSLADRFFCGTVDERYELIVVDCVRKENIKCK